MFSGILTVDEDDDYNVLIDLKTFPKRFPIVKETNERIPPIADCHNPGGTCCFTVKSKELILLRKGMIKTIPQFIRLIVIPFFQNNSFREINGYYKKGEYSHGLPGIFEGYSDILGIKDVGLTIKILIGYIKGEQMNINTPCYCGSSKKFKDCHLYKYNDLKFVDKEIILSDLNSLIVK